MVQRPNRNNKKIKRCDYNYEYDDEYDDEYDGSPSYDDEYLEYQRQKAIMKKKKRKKKKLLRKFLTVMFAVIFAYFGILAAYIGYTYINDDENDDYFINHSGINMFSGVFGFSDIPERTTVLLAGVDADETRTDSIMLLNYNSVSNEINLVSIPRDTLVEIPKDRFSVMCDVMSGFNISNPMKINHIHAYSGNDGMKYLKLQIEELLDIKIDYYVKINCEALRYLVDSIGGVEFNVEQRLYYSDPTQNLYIDLYPGEQLLDGDKAEQLVRYRYGYAQQDLHRVEVQQQFMKALISTVLDKDTVMSNPKAYLTTVIKYVTTDFGITDTVNYFSALKNINTEKIYGHTLPGTTKNASGGSVYVVDEEETNSMVYDIFKKKSVKEGETLSDEKISSKDKIIKIENGGYTTGLAGKAKELLEKNGCLVSSIGDYDGAKKDKTRIYISSENMGEDLQEYFSSSEIILDKTVTEENESDIFIVLGTKETLQE